MNDITAVHSDGSQSPKKKKKVTIELNRNLAMFLAGVIVLVVVFLWGSSYGASKQKDKQANPTSPSSSASAALSNRWNSLGTITDISDSNIKVKDSRGEVKDAKITKDTSIVDRKGQKLTTKDLKKDQKVIASGSKDSKGALTATRVRLQQ